MVPRLHASGLQLWRWTRKATSLTMSGILSCSFAPKEKARFLESEWNGKALITDGLSNPLEFSLFYVARAYARRDESLEFVQQENRRSYRWSRAQRSTVDWNQRSDWSVKTICGCNHTDFCLIDSNVAVWTIDISLHQETFGPCKMIRIRYESRPWQLTT